MEKEKNVVVQTLLHILICKFWEEETKEEIASD